VTNLSDKPKRYQPPELCGGKLSPPHWSHRAFHLLVRIITVFYCHKIKYIIFPKLGSWNMVK